MLTRSEEVNGEHGSGEKSRVTAPGAQVGLQATFSMDPPSPVLSRVAQAVADDMDSVLQALRSGWPHNRHRSTGEMCALRDEHPGPSRPNLDNKHQGAGAPPDATLHEISACKASQSSGGANESAPGCDLQARPEKESRTVQCQVRDACVQQGPGLLGEDSVAADGSTQTASALLAQAVHRAAHAAEPPIGEPQAHDSPCTDLHPHAEAAGRRLHGKSGKTSSSKPSKDVSGSFVNWHSPASAQKGVDEKRGETEAATQTQRVWLLTRTHESTQTGADVPFSQHAEAQTDRPCKRVVCMHAAVQTAPTKVPVAEKSVPPDAVEQLSEGDKQPSVLSVPLSEGGKQPGIPSVPVSEGGKQPSIPSVPVSPVVASLDLSSGSSASAGAIMNEAPPAAAPLAAPSPSCEGGMVSPKPSEAAGNVSIQAVINPSASTELQAPVHNVSQPSPEPRDSSLLGAKPSPEHGQLHSPAAVLPQEHFSKAGPSSGPESSANPAAQDLRDPGQASSSPPLPQLTLASPDGASSAMPGLSGALNTATPPALLPVHLPNGTHFVYTCSPQQHQIALSFPPSQFPAELRILEALQKGPEPGDKDRPGTPPHMCVKGADDLIDLSSRPASALMGLAQSGAMAGQSQLDFKAMASPRVLSATPEGSNRRAASTQAGISAAQQPAGLEEATTVGCANSELTLLPWHSIAAGQGGSSSSNGSDQVPQVLKAKHTCESNACECSSRKHATQRQQMQGHGADEIDRPGCANFRGTSARVHRRATRQYPRAQRCCPKQCGLQEHCCSGAECDCGVEHACSSWPSTAPRHPDRSASSWPTNVNSLDCSCQVFRCYDWNKGWVCAHCERSRCGRLGAVEATLCGMLVPCRNHQ